MKTTIETHQEMKARHSKEVNDFKGLFFAFSNEQLIEGLEKIGLKKEGTHHICSIGAGGYILKSEVKAFKEMLDRHAIERKQRLKDERQLFDSLVYELRNHEFCITYDPTDALDSLGLTSDDVPEKLLKKACAESLKSNH